MKDNICLYLMMYLILSIIYKCEKLYTKKGFFDKYFSIVHISLNSLLANLKFLVAVDDIYIEGTVSQNFV